MSKKVIRNNVEPQQETMTFGLEVANIEEKMKMKMPSVINSNH